VLVPCVGFDDTTDAVCDLVDSALLVKDLDAALSLPNPMGEMDRLVTMLTGRDFRIIVLPSVTANQAAVIKAIFRAEIATVNMVSAQLKADIARLTPMKWDSPAERAQKLAVVRRAETERRELWRQAVESSRPEHSIGSSDDGGHENRIHINDSPALRQLQRIHVGGWGGL
jgi:hypothetical protein